MDQRLRARRLTGPLHCIPMIVKDNFETIGLQSANGSLALAGFVSDKDAFQVKKIKDAGAIVIAKSNMAEWAFTPNETLSSILPGYTKNPYALDRVTGRIERRHRRGRRRELRRRRPRQRHRQFHPRAVIASGARRHPIDDGADEPRGRDAAQSARRHRRADGAHGGRRRRRVPGRRRQDPADPVTAAAAAHLPQNYAASLVRDGLKGARIGVLRFAYERDEHRSRDRAGVHARRRGSEAAPARRSSIRRRRRHRRDPPAAGHRAVHGIQVRHQPLPRGHGDKIPVKSLARS